MSEISNTPTIHLQTDRVLSLGSGCKLQFLQDINGNIIPVIMITNIKDIANNEDIIRPNAEPRLGIVKTEINDNNQLVTAITSSITLDKNNFMFVKDENNSIENYKMAYPRVFINSLGLNTNSDDLVLKYYDKIKAENPESNDIKDHLNKLQPYKDYSILTRSLEEQYVLTLDNQLIIRNNYGVENNQIVLNKQPLRMNYSISNADVSIYLDALQVLKQNSQPKTSYTIKTQLVNPKLIETIYNKMGYIAHINDTDLKFNNVRGYVSGFTLDLDNPAEDTIQIKNYKTKFEDLFSTITAQTQAMKKSSYSLQLAAAAFTPSGTISEEVLQSSLRTVDLDYAFNNGKLTIDEENGIWGVSDTGVVAFRGGGIFTATEKRADGNWKWNTGITPEGINADLITSGQLDTNLIKIYAGDHLRFQMNGDGLFAYKSWTLDGLHTTGGAHPLLNEEKLELLATLTQKEEQGILTDEESKTLKQLRDLQAGKSLDSKQYVLFNEEGLSLVAKKGAKVLNKNKTAYITVLDPDNDEIQKNPALRTLQSITRVEVSWEGFILRNWQNDRVFYARPDTGDLVMSGYVYARGGRIGHWSFNDDMLWSEAGVEENHYSVFVALNTAGQNNARYPTTPETAEFDHYELIIRNRDGDETGSLDLGEINEYAFWAGNPKPAGANFYVKKDGFLKASSGLIGGWEITADKLRSNAVSLASDTTDYTDWSEEQQTVGDDGTVSITYGSLTITEKAALWVHAKDNKNNIKYDASSSLLFISSNGNLYAQGLYFLTYGTDRIYRTSVKTLIQTAQSTADKAWRKANDAYDLAKELESKLGEALWVVSVKLSDEGELTFKKSDKLWYNGGQHKT